VPIVLSLTQKSPYLFNRLWAASGQSALESSRVLVNSGTATSTSILKNLVLDPLKVTPENAGNDFFLEGPLSIGKSHAEEAVRLLGELNNGIEGKADLRSLEEVLNSDKEWISDFTVVIAYNLEDGLLERLQNYVQHIKNPPDANSISVVNVATYPRIQMLI